VIALACYAVRRTDHFMFSLYTLQAAFKETRLKHTSAHMYLATVQDPRSQLWTDKHPSKAMLQRMVTYARSSLSMFSALALKVPFEHSASSTAAAAAASTAVVPAWVQSTIAWRVCYLCYMVAVLPLEQCSNVFVSLAVSRCSRPRWTATMPTFY